MFSSKRLTLWNRARVCKAKPIAKLYRSQLPLFNLSVTDAPLLAIDLEMTGLDANSDHILSIGWVPINRGAIDTEGAQHWLISGQRQVGDSATIHGITDSQRQSGTVKQKVMGRFLNACRGRLLLFHHAPLDVAFIDRACRIAFNSGFKPALVDTMAIEHKRLQRRSDALASGALRLAACRQRYGLPDYTGHNALTDALATAELFLAQSSADSRSKVSRYIF
jgi:DNA polymerase-3 subunit epsilon